MTRINAIIDKVLLKAIVSDLVTQQGVLNGFQHIV